MEHTVATLAFEPSEYARRTERAQRAVAEAGLDALIVTAPENICYLSGFATPGYHVFQALVVPASRPPFLVVRNIEMDNVRAYSWVERAYPIENLDIALATLADAMQAEGAARGSVGVEVDGARQSITRLDLLSELMPAAKFVPSLGLVDAQRAVKSAREVDYIRQAMAIAGSAMLAGARSLATAATDSDVAAAVHGALAAAGSEYTGSPPYVVGTVASAQTHANHARRPLGPRDPVWLEISASVQRYHGVCARIAAREPTDEVRRYFDISAGALQAMIAAMRPGVAAGTVDAAGRAAVDRFDAGKFWKNRAAYSLGLSFPPGLGEGHIIDIKRGDPRPIQAGMVFHLIPILKVPGVGAIGCTDTVLVTEAGGERLGSVPLVALTPADA